MQYLAKKSSKVKSIWFIYLLHKKPNSQYSQQITSVFNFLPCFPSFSTLVWFNHKCEIRQRNLRRYNHFGLFVCRTRNKSYNFPPDTNVITLSFFLTEVLHKYLSYAVFTFVKYNHKYETRQKSFFLDINTSLINVV